MLTISQLDLNSMTIDQVCGSGAALKPRIMRPITVIMIWTDNMTIPTELPKANFTVTETWAVECPICVYEQEAPFNEGNPMQPMKIECIACGKPFILTYERD